MNVRGVSPTNLHEIERLVSSHFNGERANGHVREITKYYRTAGSSGYHTALEYVKGKLGEYSIPSDVETYPLDGKTQLLGRQMALAWEPVDAEVNIISPVQEHVTRF